MTAQHCDFSVGATIDGQYRVLRSLGEGAYGKVFQVVSRDGNQYALKLLKLWEIAPDRQDAYLKRFKMEYETGKIDSPYLVHAYASGFTQGNPYILMEFCTNGDLTRTLPNTDYNRIAHEVLYGLQALHRNGKVHRDLKPENVLIKQDGTAALTDFGISGDRNHRLSVIDSRGIPTQIFGTYAFMPPEQLKPDNKDATVLPTTDIFSFGVMLYLLLTGELPFGQLNSQNDLAVYTTRGRKGEWNRTALQGSPFYHAIDGCLIPNYKQRLQSVDDVLQRLPNYHDNRTVDAPIHGVPVGYLLRVMQGEEYGRTYDLTWMMQNMNFLTIGRADPFIKNDIPLKEEQSTYISRRHCTLEKEPDGSFKVKDGQRDIHSYDGWQRSTNGTFVNSAEATDRGYYLRDGDILSVGDVKMRFEAYYEHPTAWATI